jgi:hypothetical protein
MTVLVWALLGFFVLSYGSACFAEEISQQGDLKKQCLAATVTAITLEIERYQQWIEVRKQQGDQQGLTELQQSLDALKADLEKYRAMDAADYSVPEKVDTVAWVGYKPEKNSILYLEDMSRSGPWYHLAGVAGGDYAVLRPDVKYRVNFIPVYPRQYGWMKSAYVYVQEFTPALQSKRIRGEVFGYKYSGPMSELVKCDNYQVYLLKDIKPGSKGELILEAKKSSFDITLTADTLSKYSYLEFVSAAGNSTIKLSDVKDDPIEISLEPRMVVKKPAIYLYPEQKMQIEVIHSFKGKILNTYPAYDNSWKVIAEPNGRLFNTRDNRYYQYLFWDGVYAFSPDHYQYKSGFYVRSEDYVSFLQTKLVAIGLNDNEINDFIVYWLPAMSHYQNCFVHFRVNDNIDGSSALEIKPAAQTTIRVFMEFSGVDDINGAPELPEQVLPTFVRKGFTLVEWGGAEIGKGKIE